MYAHSLIKCLIATTLLFSGTTSFAKGELELENFQEYTVVNTGRFNAQDITQVDPTLAEDIEVIELHNTGPLSEEGLRMAVRKTIIEDASREVRFGLNGEQRTKNVLVLTDNQRELIGTGAGFLASYTIAKTAYADEVDKQKHIMVGALIAGGSYLAVRHMLPDSMSDKQKRFVAGTIAGLLTLTAAVGKEVYDGYGHGTKDRRDAYVTALGGAVTLFSINIAF